MTGVISYSLVIVALCNVGLIARISDTHATPYVTQTIPAKCDQGVAMKQAIAQSTEPEGTVGLLEQVEKLRKEQMMEWCTCSGLTAKIRRDVNLRDNGISLDEMQSSVDKSTDIPSERYIFHEMINKIYDSPNETENDIAIKFNIACEKEMPSNPSKCPHSDGKGNTQTIPQAEKALIRDLK
jgi:hypothetical protein